MIVTFNDLGKNKRNPDYSALNNKNIIKEMKKRKKKEKKKKYRVFQSIFDKTLPKEKKKKSKNKDFDDLKILDQNELDKVLLDLPNLDNNNA